MMTEMHTSGSDLQRFVDAQDDVWPDVEAELRAGRKTSHWMWFVFPQLAGLGSSEMARHYAIADLDEARAYLAHPVLGERLQTCHGWLAGHADTSAETILGGVDAAKLRSSATLFREATSDNAVFRRTLELFFDGEPDARTIELLA